MYSIFAPNVKENKMLWFFLTIFISTFSNPTVDNEEVSVEWKKIKIKQEIHRNYHQAYRYMPKPGMPELPKRKLQYATDRDIVFPFFSRIRLQLSQLLSALSWSRKTFCKQLDQRELWLHKQKAHNKNDALLTSRLRNREK